MSGSYPASVCHPGGSPFGPVTDRPWNVHAELLDHVGFRGGKVFLRFASTNPFSCGMYGAGDLRVVIGWDHTGSPRATGDLPANIVFDSAYEFGDLVNVGPVGIYLTVLELEVSLPALLSPLGTRVNWTVASGLQHAGDGPVSMTHANLSPRTDIPLWFFASTGNLIAPGGIL